MEAKNLTASNSWVPQCSLSKILKVGLLYNVSIPELGIESLSSVRAPNFGARVWSKNCPIKTEFVVRKWHVAHCLKGRARLWKLELRSRSVLGSKFRARFWSKSCPKNLVIVVRERKKMAGKSFFFVDGGLVRFYFSTETANCCRIRPTDPSPSGWRQSSTIILTSKKH